MTGLRKGYREDILPRLMEAGGYSNIMEAPRLEKVVVGIGLGEALQNPKAMESAQVELPAITGQKPIITRAKKSIANFRLRAGQEIGIKVTLRKDRMYDFVERLISVVLPRIREFRGVPGDAFDGRGNYTLGIKEQTVFPEIDYDKVGKIRGLQISIVTTARTDEEGRQLLEMLGMPFSKD